MMALWRIYAVANPSDARWQGRKIWKEVIVRAPSAAMARLIACDLEKLTGSRANNTPNVCDWSGFTDEKLYWVHRLNPEHEASFGEKGDSDQVITAALLDDYQPS
jgi:hypothetical protein